MLADPPGRLGISHDLFSTIQIASHPPFTGLTVPHMFGAGHREAVGYSERWWPWSFPRSAERPRRDSNRKAVAGELLKHEHEDVGDIVQPLDTEPQTFCAWRTIAFAPEEAPQRSHHSGGFTKRWGHLGRSKVHRESRARARSGGRFARPPPGRWPGRPPAFRRFPVGVPRSGSRS